MSPPILYNLRHQLRRYRHVKYHVRMVAGFIFFIVASIAWMIDGWLESKASLVIQNVILLFINVIGVWRWYPKAEKEAKG